MFMGVMTTTGSVKPLSQPTKPLFLILLYQITAVTITDHVMVVLRSAVVERRKPVMPMRLPQILLIKMVMMKGVQWALWAPMVSTTMPCIMETPFSTSTCAAPGRFFRPLPSRTQAMHSSTVMRMEDTMV